MARISMWRGALLALTAGCVTAPTLWWSARPIVQVEIAARANGGNRASLPSGNTIVRPADNGVVYFELRAVLDEPVGRLPTLAIRPSAEPTFYAQRPGVLVDQHQVSVIAQLGSPDFGVSRQETYDFRLSDADGDVLLLGEIVATPREFAGGNPLLVSAIGVFASVLQVLQVFGFQRSASLVP